MEIYVLDAFLDVIGVVDVFTSFIQTHKLHEVGDFELKCPAAVKSNYDILKIDCFIGTSEHPERLFIITNVKVVQNENEYTITVTGSSADSVLKRRVYPYWQAPRPVYAKEAFDLCQPFEFRIEISDYTSFGPVTWDTLPDEQMKETFYDVIQYELSADLEQQKEQSGQITDEYINFYFGYLPLSSPDITHNNIHYRKYFTITTAYFIPNSTAPVAMVSTDMENITDYEYSVSNEGVYTSVFAMLNTAWSGTYHKQTAQDEYEDINLSYEDLYNKPRNPGTLAWATTSSTGTGCIEKLIFVDPIPASYTRPAESTSTELIPIYLDKPIGPDEKDYYLLRTTRDPKGQPIWVYYKRSESEEPEPAYQYDGVATIASAKAAVNKEIGKLIENIQGNVDTSRLDHVPFLGDSVIFRDNEHYVDLVKRVEEVQESIDSSGYRTNLTFGEPLKTIFDIWKDR